MVCERDQEGRGFMITVSCFGHNFIVFFLQLCHLWLQYCCFYLYLAFLYSKATNFKEEKLGEPQTDQLDFGFLQKLLIFSSLTHTTVILQVVIFFI